MFSGLVKSVPSIQPVFPVAWLPTGVSNSDYPDVVGRSRKMTERKACEAIGAERPKARQKRESGGRRRDLTEGAINALVKIAGQLDVARSVKSGRGLPLVIGCGMRETGFKRAAS